MVAKKIKNKLHKVHKSYSLGENSKKKVKVKAVKKKILPFHILSFLIIAILFLIDRLTKLSSKFISGKCSFFLCANYSINPGAAFSLWANFSFTRILLIIIALGVLFLITFFYFRIKRFNLFHYGLIFLFVGTLGNLTDRLFFGHVIDFITFSFLPEFPAFNISDLSNTIGVIFLIISLFKINCLKTKIAKKE